MVRNLRSWSQFGEALQKIQDLRERSPRGLQPPQFRGLGDSRWRLETTLERADVGASSRVRDSFAEYYRAVTASKGAIEAFGGERWPDLPRVARFEKRLANPGSVWLDQIMSVVPSVWGYLVYLRHHGYPSPLLDWTASPYVAAFFAFDAPAPKAECVCVYAFLQDKIHGSTSDGHLFSVGHHMRTHARHFLQHCRYSICVARDAKNGDFQFRPHADGLKDALGPNGKLVKITLPVGERIRALKNLELMNINAYSLIGSADSLIQTAARRELLLNE
jgi:hypothetical protein